MLKFPIDRVLKEELETRTRSNQFAAKETEAVQEEMEKHRGELQDVSLVPGQLAKEADKLSRSLSIEAYLSVVCCTTSYFLT